jgi:hypothetical protein
MKTYLLALLLLLSFSSYAHEVGPFVNPKVVKKVDSGNSMTFHIKDTVCPDVKTFKLVVSETSFQFQK